MDPKVPISYMYATESGTWFNLSFGKSQDCDRVSLFPYLNSGQCSDNDGRSTVLADETSPTFDCVLIDDVKSVSVIRHHIEDRC